MYAGFVYGKDSSNPISSTGQNKAKFRSDLFRFTSKTDNKTIGQTYNDNSWCFYGNATIYYASNSSTSSNSFFIKWDGEFNGTETINP